MEKPRTTSQGVRLSLTHHLLSPSTTREEEVVVSRGRRHHRHGRTVCWVTGSSTVGKEPILAMARTLRSSIADCPFLHPSVVRIFPMSKGYRVAKGQNSTCCIIYPFLPTSRLFAFVPAWEILTLIGCGRHQRIQRVSTIWREPISRTATVPSVDRAAHLASFLLPVRSSAWTFRLPIHLDSAQPQLRPLPCHHRYPTASAGCSRRSLHGEDDVMVAGGSRNDACIRLGGSGWLAPPPHS